MDPALRNGQYLLTSRFAYWGAEPERGDIVVLRDPRRTGTDFVKRIVGLPGEHVAVAEGCPVVDDRPLAEPYLEKRGPWRSARDGQWVMGEGEYFVLGDNRDDSLDSRFLGPVPRRLIVGKAWLCYWPPAKWGRVGVSSRGGG
jgi:signal peptidase I